MELTHRLIKLFDYPIADIAAAMPEASSPLWDANPYRQNKHEVHRRTRSIIFEWIPDDWQPGQTVAVEHTEHDPVFAKPVHACAEKLNALYRGKIVRLMLTELAPRAKVLQHRDGGAALVLVHRLHVPIVTNPQVKFFIDEIPHYLEPGGAYEFDNRRLHAVANDSDEWRVHLMCDIMPASLVV